MAAEAATHGTSRRMVAFARKVIIFQRVALPEIDHFWRRDVGSRLRGNDVAIGGSLELNPADVDSLVVRDLLTHDQVRLLQADTVVSERAQAEGRTLAGLGLAQPQTIPSIVPAYLERFKPKGQFAHYRG